MHVHMNTQNHHLNFRSFSTHADCHTVFEDAMQSKAQIKQPSFEVCTLFA